MICYGIRRKRPTVGYTAVGVVLTRKANAKAVRRVEDSLGVQ